MKSLALLSISSLAALVVSAPDHFQSVSKDIDISFVGRYTDSFQVPSVLCTDVPAQTVTMTQDCAPCQTGVPPGSGSGSGNGDGTSSGSGSTGGSETVTVTATVTETVTTTVVPDTTTMPPSSSSTTATLSVTDITTISTTTTSGPVSQQTFNVDVGAFTVEGTNQTTFEFRPNNVTNANVGDLVLL